MSGLGKENSSADEEPYEQPYEGDEDKVLGRPFVEEPWFNGAVGGVVLINCITIGLEIDLGDDENDLFVIVNNAFLLCYMGELLTRLYYLGTAALRDGMTCFDLFVVLAAFIEQMATDSEITKALPCVRLIRMTRILRAGKLMRLSQSQELILLFHTVARSLTTLAWMVCALTLILWTGAVAVYMAIGGSDKFATAVDPDHNGDLVKQFNNEEYFGSVFKSFYSLFQVVTLSQWSDHVARPIIEVYPITAVFFLTWTLVTSYALTMVVAANQVEDSLTTNRSNAIAIKERLKERRMQMAVHCKNLFQNADVDGSGELDIQELDQALKNDEILAALEALEVPTRVFNADALVCMLDFDGNGAVSYDELLQGIVRLDDDITYQDFSQLAFRVNNLMKRAAHLDGRLQHLSKKVHDLRLMMEGALQSLHKFYDTANVAIIYSKAKKELQEGKPYDPPPPMQPRKARRGGPPIPVNSEKDECLAVIKRMFGGGGISPQSLENRAQRSASLSPVRPLAGDRLAKGKRPTTANRLFAKLQAATDAAVAAHAAEAEVAKSQPPPATDAWLTEAPVAANQQLRQAAHQPVRSRPLDLTMTDTMPPTPEDRYGMKGIDVNPKLREVQLQIAEPQLQSPTSPKSKKKGRGKASPSPKTRRIT